MSGTHRSYTPRRARRRRRAGGRIALAGGIAGVVGMGTVVVVITMLRPDSGGSDAASPASASAGTGSKAPRTGRPLKVSTPEGYAYSMGAIKSGSDSHPLSDTSPGPSGATFAYADYVLTNMKAEPALLDFPADLFTRISKVPAAYRQRCMPQPGADDDMCTLPGHSKIIGYLDDSKPPSGGGGSDTYMPAGASYIVRVASDLPVSDAVKPDDLKLYVWNVRFVPDRRAVEMPFPTE